MIYHASDVYMLKKNWLHIYIDINKNNFKPITLFIVLGGSWEMCGMAFGCHLDHF